MAFRNRYRSHFALLVWRIRGLAYLPSSAPPITRHLHRLSDARASPGILCKNVSSLGSCLNPRHEWVSGSPTLVRHYSWWRWGGSDSKSQPVNREDELIGERPTSSSTRQADEVIARDISYEPFSSSREGAEQLLLGGTSGQGKVEQDLQLADVGSSGLDTGGIVERGVSGSFWSFLQVPVDAVVVTLDGFHNITGVPWWLTIIGSTFALRAALFPLTVTQLQKASLLARLGSQLPSPVPRPGSGASLAAQYCLFTKRRLELGAPSPAWLLAVPLIQIPLFILWIVAVRQMAMTAHPGFDTGGILWFTNLTVPVQGALGSLFPIIVAATYFINLQFYKWWLEAATVPAFIFGFYLPQGVFMYWITNNCCSLAQTVALRQPGVRASLGLPTLAELSKLRDTSQAPPHETSSLKIGAVEDMSSDDLLVLAANCISMQKEDEALQVLHFAVQKFPDKAEALFALGKVYTGRQQWLKASEYHGLVLQKTKEKELIIGASLGAGVALYNLGKRTEAIDKMSILTEMDAPRDPLAQHRYFKACITLSSVLSQEGRKAEALELLKKAAKYEPMVEKVFIPQLQKELEHKS